MALMSMLTIGLTGTGWYVAHGALRGITVSQALSSTDPRSSGDTINILLIGLDSRKDQDGNDLPWSVLKHLHAGDSDNGGYNTNTLILVHVTTDNRVIAFSIPRDDWVPFTGVPGYDHIKIKEAYGLTKQYAEEKLINQGVSNQKQLETRGREAGRAATLRAVRNLTGVPIDYFAEINLAGFYDLAQSLDGVEVCLKEAVYDEYSGANFPAGRQTLNAEEALAFVRQRHGLDNGDLDRTHRQQAFLVSVMRQLQDAGTFTDLTKLQKLIAVARKNIVLSAGWDEHQFQRIGELAGGKVEYRTLPVVRYDNIDGQDVNIIDPAAIKAEVAAAFGTSQPTSTTAIPTSPPDPSIVIDVINASSTTGLGSQVARTLEKRGYTIGQVRSRVSGEPTSTSVDYGSGGAATARIVAVLLGVDPADQADSSVSTDHIQVFIGDDYTPQTQYQNSTETPQANRFSAGQDATTETDPTPDRGKPIDGMGIPCVN